MSNTNTNSGTSSRRRARQMGADNAKCESLKNECERRLKMSRMFTQLQATVPGVLPKATKEVIVNETIEYIKELEKKKQKLEELKESMKQVQEGKLMLPRSSADNTNSSVTVTVSNNVAFFGIQSQARPGLITLIFKVLSNHQAEILAANVSVNQGELTLAITAVLQDGDGNGTLEIIKIEIMSLLS